MELRKTIIPGCYELLPKVLRDSRGSFVKTFHADHFAELGLEINWLEEYYSVSAKGVLRGFHFQLPPHDLDKIVYCPNGRVFDVVLDLRIGSPSYGRHCSFDLNSDAANIIYIPKGCAHGFYTLSDQALMMYKVNAVYTPAADTGILWSSVGVVWPDHNLLISGRDAGFKPFAEFISPFTWSG